MTRFAPDTGTGWFDRPILYFGNDWDAENRTSSHQMALQLRGMTELIYVECPGLRRPVATARDFRKLFSKIRKTLSGPRIRDGMRVYTLLQLPFHGNPLMRWVNRRIVQWQVSRIRAQLKRPAPPLLWFVIPHVYFLAALQRNCATVYYCIDKYAALPGVDSIAVNAMDESLTRDADVVFVASEKLLEDKRRTRPDAALSPHGVDFDAFERAQQPCTRPPDFPEWPGPVIGFFGSLESWIDLELLAFLAIQRPQWLIALVGHPAVDVGALRQLPNVALLGRKPFAVLPDYGHFFDVCLLPYLLTEQVLNSNPIKLREYLAMGKPTVSVRFPHAEQFDRVVYLADGHEEFLLQTERALAEDDESARTRRIASVRDSTWHARASAALAHVQARLASLATLEKKS